MKSTTKVCIVGSSDGLIGKSLGEKIDSHEIVVRINQPEISGFEKDVGSRLNHSFISIWQIAKRSTVSNLCDICDKEIENSKPLTRIGSTVNKDCFERLRNEEGESAVVLPTSKLFFGLDYDFHAFYREISPLIDDSIMINFIDTFSNMKKWRKRGFSKNPTNGTLVVDYYRRFCGRINIAGFGCPSDGVLVPQEKYCHYWDTNKEKDIPAMHKYHDPNMDTVWLNRLHKKNKINILELDEWVEQ